MKSYSKKSVSPKQFIARLDNYQQKHSYLSLPFAIVKKFHDDEGGHQAALIAYYGFLSLFPLLIVATAIIQAITQNNTELGDRLMKGVISYFPAIGDTLAASLHAPSKTGFFLIISLLIAFYGARGVADAVQHAIHVIWAVPRRKRAEFPHSTIRSFSIIIFAGTGLVLSSVLLGYSTGSDLPYVVKIAYGTLSFIMLFVVFWGVFTYGSSARKRHVANVPGAIIAAFCLFLFQSAGGFIMSYLLTIRSVLYAQFAIVLALIFWIYLQAIVVLYSLEYNTVRAHRLYPRAIDDKKPTYADIQAHKLYAARDDYNYDSSL